MLQRCFDIVLSGFTLGLLLPFFLILGVLLRFTGEGEIFFQQARIGRRGETFKLYKFATMLKDSPNMEMGTVTLKNDPRILPIGGFLRKTKINELPQLINIFIGDMSIVGPRPQTKRCFDVFPVAHQRKIIQVRPGLSGIGSIIFRNEENMLNLNKDPDVFYDNIIMPYKGCLESWYVSHQNIWSYFIIIGLTIWVVFGFSTDLAWKIFKDLPVLPNELEEWV